jgi:Uma2 family endonuclease
MSMVHTAPRSGRYSVERYFELAKKGVIAAQDRVELLDGLIVAMAPQTSPHASAVHRVGSILKAKLGDAVMMRVQKSFFAGRESLPEPDIAIVPGNAEDYAHKHPTKAELIVEVAETSIVQDRITKAAIYARAGVPCYWIVNLRDRRVEAFGEPDRWKSQYTSFLRVTGRQTVTIDGHPDVAFSAKELLPPPPSRNAS